MRIGWLWTPILTTCLVLATVGIAWAHTTVSPEQVPAGSTETFTVRAPGEMDVPIVQERIEIPEGFEVMDVPETPGWEFELEQDASGRTTAIVWSGGEIPPDETQEFTFEARAPEEPGEYVWRAFDTYEDGSVSEWTGPENSEEPASVVRVVQEGSRTDVPGAEAEEHETTNPETKSGKEGVPKSGGIAPVVLYGSIGFCGIALAVSLMTLLRRSGT